VTVPLAGEVGELLVALIRNACVNDGTPDSGGERRSVDTLHAYLGEPGTVFEPHPGRASVLYRIPGARPGSPSLMLMGHLDVVPAPEEGWTVDPFAAERSDGFIWGRGAVDMLDQTAAMAAVVKRHLDGRAPRLAGDLLFLAVADEEAAGHLGARWLVEHHPAEVACDYLVTEIAAPRLPWSGGTPVTVAEKGPQWRRLRTTGVSGHGSQPYGTRNALAPLARAVARLGENPPPAQITEEWRRFVAAWMPDPTLADALVDASRIDGAIEDVARSDPGLARWIHACTHMTLSVNTLHAGAKANVVPSAAHAEVDIRTLPGQGEQAVSEHITGVLGPDLDQIVAVEAMETQEAGGSVPSGPLWEAIADGLAAFGAGPAVPMPIPVATDARFFRPLGTVCYGFGLLDDRIGFGDFLTMFHGPDERVGEASLGTTAALYDAVLRRFSDLTAR
jgi:acetylornithine deacetylase/succinyl-diaminopimelate desuccinylase-like protein